ncbi:MAG: tetratricopeptide repeat protein [Amylibacter sp.]|nr:tetratricopeptide repeat protein [Amylibacter sp.]
MTRQFPNTTALHDFLGMAHMGLENYGQSIENFRKVLQLQPNYPEAHNNLGAALKAKGHLDEAFQSYQKALQLKPDYAEAHNNLGIAYQEQSAFDLAITSFENALQYAPNYADAYFNLGSAYKEISALPKAIASFEKGLSINPNNAEAQNHLGNALQADGRLDDAYICYQKALKIDPNFFRTYLNIGSTLKAQGKTEEAITNYKKVLQLQPDYAEAYRNYASMQKFKAEDEYTRQSAKLLAEQSLPPKDQMHLNFALGKVRLDLGKTAEGIAFLKAGNALRKAELNYDISIDRNLFSDIKQLFESKTSSLKPDNAQAPTPIFILGMPRSGTTLVEQIISSHSDVYGTGELRYLGDIIDKIDLNIPLDESTLKTIRAEYYDRISGLNTDCKFITDKMPANFKWTGFIKQAFPEAKIVHTNRNPAAVCWSNFKLYFPADGMRFTFGMEDIAHYYGLYQDIMGFWRKKYPDGFYDISYEKLTENQLSETQNLLTYLDLGWQDAVMDFHKNTRSVATASNQQVRTKMYKGSSQEWEKHKDHLGPMLNILEALPKG